MSEFKLMERFVAHTRVRTVLRGAESYHAFGTAQSFTRDVAKTFGTTLLNASSIEIWEMGTRYAARPLFSDLNRRRIRSWCVVSCWNQASVWPVRPMSNPPFGDDFFQPCLGLHIVTSFPRPRLCKRAPYCGSLGGPLCKASPFFLMVIPCHPQFFSSYASFLTSETPLDIPLMIMFSSQDFLICFGSFFPRGAGFRSSITFWWPSFLARS